jgi:predicted nucleotidyltransferase
MIERDAEVRRTLEQNGIPYALIGGVALAARGHARFTLDVDYLVVERRVLSADLWADVSSIGATVEINRGDFEDPLAGVVRILLPNGTKADVVVAKYRWQKEVLERAETLDLEGWKVPVPRTSDLILLKLFAGGYQDLNDIHSLLSGGDRSSLVEEIESRIEELPESMQELWKKIPHGP